ncbi:MAG: SRPBCC family protein [Minicystis sp.]
MSVWFDCDSCWDGFLDGAPARVDLTELIPAPPAEVFASIVDPARRAAWSPGVREARWLSPSPPGVGSERRVIHPLLRADQRLAVLEPARRCAFYAVRTGSPALSQLMEEFVLHEERWGTRVRWRVGWRLRLPLRLLEPSTVAAAGRVLPSHLAGLRAYCDARSAAPAAR